MRATDRTWTLTAVVAASVLAGAAGLSSAIGQPTARPAAANTLIATITDVTPPDQAYTTELNVTGKVTAASHKFAPRKCRVSRTIDVLSHTVGGRILNIGSSYPSNKSGHFKVGIRFEYAGYLDDGTFRDGYAPEGGGTATFTLTTDKQTVPKAKGEFFKTYTCRPLSVTVQITVPPVPGA